MAFEDVVLVDSAAANQTYKMIGGVSSDGKAIRRNMAIALETPRLLTTSHQQTGKGLSILDRHLHRLDRTLLDADGITPYTGSMYLVCVMPRRVITSAIAWDMYVELKSRFPNEAALTAFLQGEL